MDNRFFTAFATFSECYQRGKKIDGGVPRGIVIHSTAANNPYLRRYVLDEKRCGVNPYKNYMGSENAAKGGNYTTPHAVAGLDINNQLAIAQLLPFTMKCYGCGQGTRGSYNDTHIQIEMCEDDLTDSAYVSDMLEMVAKWCADIIREYPTIGINDIVSHREAHARGFASNHGDPEHWIEQHDFTMDKFRAMVAKYLEPRKLYRVQIGAFANRDNATAFLELARQAGFNDAFITVSE